MRLESDMEKILFVAYQFPPRGGPGVQRSTALVKYLREFNYDPVVLTVREEDIRKGGYTIDSSLLTAVPAGIHIVRTPSYEPIERINSLTRLRLFRFAWALNFRKYWERSAAWPEEVYAEAAKLVRAHGIKLVYTTSGPYSSMLLGRRLQQELGLKWVADLRDPYTDAYAWQFPSKLHWKKQRRWEEEMFALPDKLVVNSPAVKRLYLQRKLVPEHKITVITNGY